MNEGRRPITDEERPHLEELGRHLRGLRDAAGMTQADLGTLAAVKGPTVSAIERGRRRTRVPTLRRLLVPLVPEDSLEVVLAELVEVAGPAIAPDVAAEYAARVERRRLAREKAMRPRQIDTWTKELERLKRERRHVSGDLVRRTWDSLIENAQARLDELLEADSAEHRETSATGSQDR